MATETKTVSRKPRRWLRVLVGFVICMIVGLVMLYFIGTSEWGFKKVILPRVSAAMNADVTVESASISPFSSVYLRGLKVVTKGTEPLVTAKEVRARYSLMDIIKGNLNVGEVTLDSPTVTLITYADGTSNLDPITKGDKEKKVHEKKEPKAKKEDKASQLNLQKFALVNATVRQITQHKDGSQEVLQLSGVNVTAADLANNKTGKLTLAADLMLDKGLNTASNAPVTGKVAGDFTIALDAALRPTLAKGQTKAEMNDPSLGKALTMDLSVDAAMGSGNVFDLNAVKIALTKTERADNVLTIGGHIDLTKPNAWAGNVKITSDGLDLTTYYDMFSKKNTNVTQTAKVEKPAPAEAKESKQEGEPAPIKLPFAQLVEEVSIAKIFLREVTMSNLVWKTTIADGRVKLNPFSVTLNGAPVSATADLNLAVAGFEYDLNMKMDRVPVEPLVNTFQPERKGQVKGDLLVNAQVKGAGVTGAGFKKNLQGVLLVNLTNANVEVSKFEKVQRLLKPLASALATPELANSPLTWIDTQIGIANGVATITNATVRSYFFNAGVNGTMTINEVLTNSTLNMPVQLAVAGSVAKRLQFLSVKESDVIALPHFYTIGGTLGKPAPHIDTSALLKGAASETIQRLGGDKLLKNLGGSLGLGGAANNNTNATGTNAPAKKKKGDKLNLNDFLK